jgi:hypothetical protein
MFLTSDATCIKYITYGSVSQTVVCRPPVVRGDLQAVMEEKALK